MSRVVWLADLNWWQFSTLAYGAIALPLSLLLWISGSENAQWRSYREWLWVLVPSILWLTLICWDVTILYTARIFFYHAGAGAMSALVLLPRIMIRWPEHYQSKVMKYSTVVVCALVVGLFAKLASI